MNAEWRCALLAAALGAAGGVFAEAAAEKDRPAENGDAVRGESIYNARCSACHSPDANRVGPPWSGMTPGGTRGRWSQATRPR
ncbi:c-type cytochrome [Hyphococcus sp.]|uniref:c-type cytochrome n=1 Tax=Hyphococcus sp. TaxID=2038636 RepID=UPI0037501624